MMKTQSGRSRAVRRLVGFVIGVVLIAAAVYALSRNREDLRTAIESARQAPWWLIALTLILPLANAVVVALSFWTLMRRYGAVPFADMFALICTSWLLNYLPMRPGLIGRLAFHKLVHKVSLKSSVAVSVALAMMSGLAAAHMLAIGIAGSRGISLGLAVLVVTTVGMYYLSGVAADRSPAGAVPRRDLRYALLYRYADMLVWALRMWVCFAIVGTQIDLHTAILIAAAVQIAYLFPLTGAGLGVVEWAVGLVATFVLVDATPQIGIAAALVSRVSELPVTVLSGLIGSAYIARRRVKAGGSPDQAAPKS